MKVQKEQMACCTF